MKQTPKQKELAKLRRELVKRKDEWSKIARESGLSLNWVRKFGSGETTNPGVLTVEKLEVYLRRGKS
jgi:DNA-binding phage protein